jgi:hypothetical protein
MESNSLVRNEVLGVRNVLVEDDKLPKNSVIVDDAVKQSDSTATLPLAAAPTGRAIEGLGVRFLVQKGLS